MRLGICYVGNFYMAGLLGKPEGKRPLARPRSMWEDNIDIL
jgi:hypothetical protein